MPNTKPKPFAKLNKKQKMFVAEYMKDFNGTQACIRVGYSVKAAHAQAFYLINHPAISLEIKNRMQSRERAIDISSDNVLQEIGLIGFSDMGAFLKKNEDGSFVDPPEVDWAKLKPEQTKLITELKMSPKTGRVIAFKMASKLGGLELLGRYHKLFTDKVEHDLSGDLINRLNAGRTRLNEQRPVIDVQRDQEQ